MVLHEATSDHGNSTEYLPMGVLALTPLNLDESYPDVDALPMPYFAFGISDEDDEDDMEEDGFSDMEEEEFDDDEDEDDDFDEDEDDDFDEDEDDDFEYDEDDDFEYDED